MFAPEHAINRISEVAPGVRLLSEPVCAAAEASRLFLMAQPPLLSQEGSDQPHIHLQLHRGKITLPLPYLIAKPYNVSPAATTTPSPGPFSRMNSNCGTWPTRHHAVRSSVWRAHRRRSKPPSAPTTAVWNPWWSPRRPTPASPCPRSRRAPPRRGWSWRPTSTRRPSRRSSYA